jgi:hypothetical protein
MINLVTLNPTLSMYIILYMSMTVVQKNLTDTELNDIYFEWRQQEKRKY